MARPLPHTALALALPSLIAAGCTLQSDIGGPCGAPRSFLKNSASPASPCREQFYFPTGITIDPDGDVAYVSSGNADLRYSGGTVATVDLGFFECAMATARAGYPTPNTLPECAPYASQLAQIHPYIDPATAPSSLPGSEIGTGCRPDLLDPTIVECDEEPFITDAVRTGNFAGTIRVQQLPLPTSCGPRPKSPDGIERRRLWLPVRGDPSVTFVDVVKSSTASTCPTQTVGGINVAGKACAPGTCLCCADPNNSDPEVPNSCDAQRITVRDFPYGSQNPGAQCSSDTTTCVQIPADPFGIALDEGCLPDDTVYSRVVIAHLTGGEVTLIDSQDTFPVSQAGMTIAQNAQPVVLDERGGFFNADASGRRGGFDVAPRTPGDPLSYWYATSRLNPQVALFRLAEVDLILPAGSFSVALGSGPFAVGADVRDIVFDPCSPAPKGRCDPKTSGPAPGSAASPDGCCGGVNQRCSTDGDCCSGQCLASDATGVRRCGAGDQGCRAFVIEEQPPSVFTLDTRIEPNFPPAGFPRNQVVDTIDVCQGAAHLAMQQSFDAADGVLPGGRPRTRLYAVCFDSGQVAVVDPDEARLLDTILVGRGPSQIAFNFGPGMPVPAGTRKRRGYVTDFIDMTIAVIDLEPSSPTYDRVIGRIGITQPPPSQGTM